MKAKRILALVLSLLLVISGIPAVLADEAEPVETETVENATYAAATSGTCGVDGSSLKWSFSNGTLTISGKGKMRDYQYYRDPAPWKDHAIKTVKIGKGVTSIGEHAFYFCETLRTVTIPSGVTSIGTGAFFMCADLQSVTIPNTVTNIGGSAFCGCDALQSVTIPDSVTSIGDSAFSGCDALQSVTIPDSVTSIGIGAFSDCTSLRSAEIPGSVKEISSWAFSRCPVLRSVTMGDGVQRIGDRAFDSCRALQAVTIPKSVTCIELQAFLICPALTSVVIPSGVTEIGKHAFGYDLNLKPYPGFTIIGFAGTAAEQYAAENKFEFSSLGSAPPPEPTASPKPTALAAPKLTDVKANSESSITVTWNKVAGAENYQVFYKGGGKTSWTKLAAVTGTSYTWTKAKANKKYSFTVRCLSKDGTKYTSDYDKTGKSVTTPLAAPKLSSVKNTSSGIQFTWKKVSGAKAYRVYFKTGDGDWKKIGDTEETSYTRKDKNLKPGTKYTFTVRAVDQNGRTSGYNETGKAVTYVKSSSVSKVENTTAGMQITWKASAGAAKYALYYKTTGGWNKVVTSSKTSYTWTKAKSGTKYTFTVKALAKDGSAASYNSGLGLTYIAAPEKITAKKSGSTGIKISWAKVSGAAKYRIYYKTTGDWKKLKDVTGTSYMWTEAVKGTKYTFTVRAVAKDGKTTSAYDTKGKSIKR